MKRPPAGTKVRVLVEAVVLGDHWQDEAEHDVTVIEIEGGWVYDWKTSDLEVVGE